MQLQEDLIKLNPRDVRKWERTGRIDECDYETLDKVITTIIKRHQEAILLTDELNEAFNKLIFTHLLFATLVICFFAVAAKASTGAAYVLNNYATIITMMMTIFVICYCSELLSAASSGIANAIDKTNWFIGSLKYQKTLQFIILRSHKPCSLKSLDYSPIGIKTFNTVLKTTWSYFSLASQMYDKRN
uniref:Odorant receptor n=1 Tax=Leucinodes orbonalis TaxID=711050 RepID=A0AAU0QMJ4_9NEOP|nr:odorant receptor [Leucinodes orbonalis]